MYKEPKHRDNLILSCSRYPRGSDSLLLWRFAQLSLTSCQPSRVCRVENQNLSQILIGLNRKALIRLLKGL